MELTEIETQWMKLGIVIVNKSKIANAQAITVNVA